MGIFKHTLKIQNVFDKKNPKFQNMFCYIGINKIIKYIVVLK